MPTLELSLDEGQFGCHTTQADRLLMFLLQFNTNGLQPSTKGVLFVPYFAFDTVAFDLVDHNILIDLTVLI